LGSDDGASFLMATFDEIEENACLRCVKARIADFVDLCGAPHKSTYVESSVMCSMTATILKNA
jgi:hypothetical protein